MSIPIKPPSKGKTVMDEKINVKAIIQKLTSRWHYFFFTLLVLLPLAYAYNEFADSIYQVRASILLNGQVKNGMDTEKFMKGMELMTSHTEIEDEIGILKSYNQVGSTLQKLDFGVSYFEKQNFKTFEKYGNDCAFKVEMDSTVNQIVNVPIFIKRTSTKTYSVHVAAKNASTYNFYTNQPTEHLPVTSIDHTRGNDK